MPRLPPVRFAPLRSETVRWSRARAWLAAPLLVGWLGSGSCTISACYEECDPCFSACKCTSTCHAHLHAGTGPRIQSCCSRIAESSATRFVRELEVLDGPRTPSDPEMPEARLVEFARAVLAANAEFFSAQPAPRWTLEAVEVLDRARGLTFSLDDDARRANSVTLWFDVHGRLLATTQIVERRPS
jgi:hypothetical protein